MLQSHIAPSTATAYAAHERYFLHFLARLYGARGDMDAAVRHMRAQLRDPSAHIIASYVAYLAQPNAAGVRRTYRTIKQYLKGVTHLLCQYNNAGVLSDMYLVQIALQAARRTNGVQPKPKAPITPDVLQFFVSSLSRSTSAGAAMRAAMIICFFAMLRKCSVCADRTQPLSSFTGLLRADITVSSADYCLDICLRHAKTNQFGERVTKIRVAGLRGHALDPVAAFQRMCQLCPVAGDRPAFCARANGRVQVLTHQDFVTTTKRLITRMGGDATAYSGHSFRRGGATLAHAAGVPDLDIMRIGDWTSNQYLDYIWRSPERCVSASRTMLSAIARGDLPDLRLGVMHR
jgi:hypothetical protein